MQASNIKPAQLRKWATKWVIEYTYNGKRYAPTFGLNRIHNKKLRQKQANRLLKEINAKLFQGIDPQSKTKALPDLPKNDRLLVATGDALYFAHQIDISNKEHNTVRGYKQHYVAFRRWLEEHKYIKEPIGTLTTIIAQDYLDHLIIEKKLTDITYENHRNTCKRLFKKLQKRGYVTANIFAACDKRAADAETEKTPLSPIQFKRIMELVKADYPEMKLPILLIYCCLFRTVEVTRLRVGHFDLRRKRIVLPPKVVIKKSRKQKIKRIPKSLLPLLAQHFRCCKNSDYVFSKIDGWVPGAEKIRDRMLQKRFKQIRDLLGLSEKVTLYRFKDTGIAHLLDKGINISDISEQASHDHIEQTYHYARRLGYGASDSLLDAFPSID